MKSYAVGKSILEEAEVVNISKHGLWLNVKGREYFLDFENFPWFKSTKISQILSVNLLHGNHLYWPELDVDLELQSIQFPDRYPLIYKPAQ